MKKWILLSLIGLAAGIYFVFNYLNPGDSQFPVRIKQNIKQDTSNTESQKEEQYTYEVVLSDLEIPWSIVFTSPNRMLITERPGRIREVISGVLEEKPALVFDEVSSDAEEGLMGMIKHPNYESNKWIYVCLAYKNSGNYYDKIIRLIDGPNGLERSIELIDNIPAAKYHAGCELGFGPDSMLYVTTGDASSKDLAQEQDSLAGKILRMTDQGEIPSDNPFSDSYVYTLGHRNPQGIDWHPTTKELYSSEHGPSGFDGPGGGDEINLIKSGDNYGWPLVSHDKSKEGLTSPLIQFTPAEAPASLIIYSGQVFTSFTNNIFFAALRGEGIIRMQVDGDRVLWVEKMNIDVGRVRELKQGPDGYIYFTTSNRDGRGEVREGDDKIYRIIPE
jgi:glucose/arabinose dehydrogenase